MSDLWPGLSEDLSISYELDNLSWAITLNYAIPTY